MLAFATAPLAVVLVARTVAWTGDFVWLYLLSAGVMALAFAVALALPRTGLQPGPVPAAAEVSA